MSYAIHQKQSRKICILIKKFLKTGKANRKTVDRQAGNYGAELSKVKPDTEGTVGAGDDLFKRKGSVC